MWKEQGTYEIRVKAKDVNDTQSEWSDPLLVTMPRNRALANSLLLWFSEQFPLLERLLSFLL